MRLASLLTLGLAGLVGLAGLAGLGGCSQEGVLGSLDKTSPGGVRPREAAIAAGGSSTCVKTKSEEARCWGSNDTGALGLGVSSSEVKTSATPVAPEALGPVKGLYAGELASCAVRTTGELYCWGQVGIISTQEKRLVREFIVVLNPFAVIDAVGDVASVAVGRFFLCMLTAAGEVRCMGRGDVGQLGLGDTEDQILPTTVKGMDGTATSLSASMGGQFACATTTAGSVFCWGNGSKGQIGDASASADADASANANAIVALPKKIEGLPEPAKEVAAGAEHVCARLASGRVACWGQGAEGQLGDGRKEASASPVLADITDVTSLSAGRAHTCAVRSEGSVFCWGSDKEGQSGGGSSVPWITLDASFKARQTTCGLAHSCAYGEGGRVSCWGSNAVSQLGPKTATF